jgi:hypothetical protein
VARADAESRRRSRDGYDGSVTRFRSIRLDVPEIEAERATDTHAFTRRS